MTQSIKNLRVSQSMNKNRVVFLLAFASIMLLSQSLKLTGYNDHFMSSPIHHDFIFHANQLHMLTSTSIDYNSKIQQIDPNLQVAVDINTRVQKVEKQYLGHQEEVRILGDFEFPENIDLSNAKCTQLKTNDIQALTMRTTEINDYLSKAIPSINFIQDPDERAIVQRNIESQILVMESVKKFLQSNCKTKVNISRTTFVSNPNANNWILGQWTYQQFVQSYVNTMNSNPKTTKCPLEKPYFDGQNCIDCKYPHNVFNMKEGKCTACPYSLIVNVKTRQCVSQIQYVNNIMDTQNPWVTKQENMEKIVQNYNTEKNMPSSVVCPFGTPFIVGQKCSTCPEGKVYNLDEQVCNTIPYNMKYDANLHKVVEQLDGYQTDTEISNNVMDDLHECPDQFPYFDNITCINCQFPTYFNQRTLKCHECPDLEKCHPQHHETKYVSNLQNQNLTGASPDAVRDYINNQHKLLDQGKDVKQCPLQTPFYQTSSRKCISCQGETPLFNVSSLKCTACSNSSLYNQQNKMCQQKEVNYKSNPLANKLLADDKEEYKKTLAENPNEPCPQETPYYNGQECIVCQDEELFDTQELQCTECENGTEYNQDNWQCKQIAVITEPEQPEPECNTTKTHPDAEKLWIKNQTQYKEQYNETQQCGVCDQDTPYSTIDDCIQCPETPESTDDIFNTTSLECTSCPEGTHYNPQSQNCTKTKPVVCFPGSTENLVGTPNYTAQEYLDEFDRIDPNVYNVDDCDCGNESNSFSTVEGCVVCGEQDQEKYYYNVRNKTCRKCSSYDEEQRICLDDVIYVTNTTNKTRFFSTEEGNATDYIDEQDDLANKSSNDSFYRRCPVEKPFAIDNKCQQCEDMFNTDKENCSKCENGTTFNKQLKICEAANNQYISNLKRGVPSYYAQNKSKIVEDYKKAKEEGADVCPFETPFYSYQNKCIKCPEEYDYFNLDTRKCENCSEDQKFNQIASACQQDPTDRYTSLQSPNLLYDGQPKAYYQYQNDKAIEDGATECLPEAPYYTINNKCEQCTEQKPYFNLLTRKCTECPEGTTYSAEQHECQSPIGDPVTPQVTLEKSLANLFT